MQLIEDRYLYVLHNSLPYQDLTLGQKNMTIQKAGVEALDKESEFKRKAREAL